MDAKKKCNEKNITNKNNKGINEGLLSRQQEGIKLFQQKYRFRKNCKNAYPNARMIN